MYNKITACLCMLLTLLSLQLEAQIIPQDPRIRKGRLANGFSYYIMANKIPSKSVQLQLVNNVGSILEEEDERGYAHFLEHMNFNGTRHFPGNELVNFLEKAGVKFGADLNAHTSYDETVYELPLSLNDPSLLYKGLQIMRDWAQEANLDAIEIDKEKGVILEEKRLKSGMQERMNASYMPLIFSNSRYAERSPIGLEEVIKSATPEKMRRFYKKWYRPDLQALIVVGAIDVAQVEKQVKALFGSLTLPAGVHPRTAYTVPVSTASRYMMVTDPEMSSQTIQLFSKYKLSPMVSQADYRAGIIGTIFRQLLAARINERKSSLQGQAFSSFSASITPFVGGTEMFSVEVSAPKGKLQSAFEQSRNILLQLKAYGFTSDELERAKVQYLRSIDNAVKTKAQRSSQEYLGMFKDNYLQNAAMPSIEWEQQFSMNVLPSLKLSDFNERIVGLLNDEQMDRLVLGPESEKAQLPTEAMLQDWMKTTAAKTQVPYVESNIKTILLPELPIAGKVVAREQLDKTGMARITLSNGMRILLKPTDFKRDEILFAGFSSGGTNSFEGDRFYDASLLNSISTFGLSEFSPLELSRMINGKILSVTPFFSGSSHGVSGMSTRVDMETALQLVYLQFTAARGDSIKFGQLKAQIKENLKNRHLNPESAFSDSINHVFHNYDPRFLPPTAEKIEQIELRNVLKMYHGHFADAAGFTFVFVGDFELGKLIPLLEQYLGSLPARHTDRMAISPWFQPPTGQLTKKVYGGTENKASVSMVLSADFEYSALNKMTLTALGEILQMKLIQNLRERAAEVYSPSVSTSATKLPKAWYNVSISFGCAPENVDKLIKMVEADMEILRTTGPEVDEVLKFKAAQVKNIELAMKSNEFWLTYLSGQLENQEDILQISNVKEYLDQITPELLKRAAKRYLSDANKIKFILLPLQSK